MVMNGKTVIECKNMFSTCSCSVVASLIQHMNYDFALGSIG